MPPGRSQAELQAQRTKLANSYAELLNQFANPELSSVGNYTLGRLIGKGSFGKVYLAHHKLTNGSKVVLKSAKKNDANLAREIHHHRQFLHPHIARLYEVIVTESLVWLVLEYCPGDELYNYLLQHGALEPAKVQKIFTQLVGAVSFVHGKACVHRDLKLENILLDKHENVKLVDFGFTREYEGKSSYLQTWCGTICYSAPEMLKGEKYAGEKVDVWSLGIILYALLVGELPFDDDDENVTKTRILKEDPVYPAHIPQGAKDLLVKLLSRRPFARPSLSDILMDPWLADNAPQQQAILKLQQPAPFTTELEKEVLQRMRSAGVDIDQVIENVLSQRCDALAGWWALLLEKEERKAKRRERKRKEKEAEAKSIRRLSAASSRLDRLGGTIKEADEEGLQSPLIGDPPKSRGRSMKRASTASMAPDLPRLPEVQTTPDADRPPPPIEKDSIKSRNSSLTRPPLPPKENRRSRSSMLQVVSTNPDLLSPNGFTSSRRRRYQQNIFFGHLASLKHWFKESAKRARSPASKPNSATSPKPTTSTFSGKSKSPTAPSARRTSTTTSMPPNHPISRSDLPNRTTYPPRPRVTTHASTSTTTSKHRPSLSPSPITPRSSFRRSSAGLRGRKSTSSSVSSVRSIHHHHTHSKASSTSSASLASPSASATPKASQKSPHSSVVKVLPATPTSSSFPSNIRVVRGFGGSGGGGGEGTAAFGVPPPSPGLVFAKRKRSPFKGPMLGVAAERGRERGPGSRSGSVQGRRSGEVIEEEDEDEEGTYDAQAQFLAFQREIGGVLHL
ncbi:kinase-like protein [Patellaria atrata CBS 101060]|uniref:Kinase-like protein n=1 Tax=Patellaria atrata CBS 101060 TaxID=1346257 RepID=A0A9P4SHN0_9PEZI|nr:kinase-like protein [Patellaria atrata CBS 101060]